jgi:hypothetical protein
MTERGQVYQKMMFQDSLGCWTDESHNKKEKRVLGSILENGENILWWKAIS